MGEWLDEHVKLQHLRQGDTFYDCGYGICYKLTALEDCRRDINGYFLDAVRQDGSTITLFEVYEQDPRPDYPKGYALTLYRIPPIRCRRVL